MSVSQNVKAFFCSYCTHIDVAGQQVRCSREGCDCSEPFAFGTILDWYANLYYHLDNRNLIEYETLMAEDDKRFWTIQRKLHNRWKAHVRHSPYLYTRTTQLRLKPETAALFRTTMEQAADAGDLLMTAMGWLLLLNDVLVPLRDELRLRHDNNMVIPTVRGPLLYKCESPFLSYLAGFTEFRLPVDPNYLILRNKVNLFYLVKDHYPHYTVTHRYLPLPALGAGNISDWKLGFMPGKFRVDRDYRYKIDAEPNGDGMLPFSFTGLRDKRSYGKTVRDRVGQLLDENPDILMLPELMTPLPLQEELKLLLKRKAEQRSHAGQRHRTALMMTGSFHVKHADLDGNAAKSKRIYNYAQVVDRLGDNIADIYKMNRFVLARDEHHGGELIPFRTDDGVETNAYDKREIVLWDTQWGRIAVLICIDFINVNLGEVLHDRQVDLIFLMTMTPSPAGGKFIRRMQEYGERNQAVIIACNHLGVDTPQKQADGRTREDRIVVYLPGFKKVFTASDEAKVYRLGDIADKLNRESAP